MRHIQALEDERLPRNAEFNFRARAKNMVDKWQGMMAPTNGAAPASDAPAEDAKMDDAKDAEETPKTNGTAEVPVEAEAINEGAFPPVSIYLSLTSSLSICRCRPVRIG